MERHCQNYVAAQFRAADLGRVGDAADDRAVSFPPLPQQPDVEVHIGFRTNERSASSGCRPAVREHAPSSVRSARGAEAFHLRNESARASRCCSEKP